MSKKVNRASGFTLIELMIVLAIVAIIIAIALPGYQEQIRKTKRSIARGELLEVLGRQEQYFVNNKTYADLLTKLGYSEAVSNTYSVDDDTNSGATGSGIYNIKLTFVNATQFDLEATPTGRDPRCGKLTIDEKGVKGSATSNNDCW
jgi:type IV pilus assembly protein PilE